MKFLPNHLLKLIGTTVLLFTFGIWTLNAVVFPENQNTLQQGITIAGTVTDGTGAILPGVNVVIKGTVIGVISDSNGCYSINVPNSDVVLVFSFVGYTTQEIAVEGRQIIDVTLVEGSQLIDEVVVVGYGVQKKIHLTGSVVTVDAEKITNRAIPNLSSSLAGLAPGVRITQGRGTPGDESVSIQIRGLGSINGGSPMILVDGVIADMTVINPDDVESISILKDASSAAIYGSRAANGVVLVTTKKGKKEKPRVTVSALWAQEKAETKLKFMSDMPTYMRLHNQAQINNTLTSSWFSEESIKGWEEANKNPNGTYTDPVTGNKIPNWLAYPNTDWAQIMFQPTMYHRYNVSVSGGGETSTYMISGSFQENPGTLENTALKRFNLRANVEAKVADFLTVGTQTWATKEFKEPGATDMTYFYQAYPGINPKYKGLYGASEDPNMPGMNNLLHSIASQGGMNEYTRINTSWFAKVDIWNGISAEAKFNYSEYQRQDEHYSQNMPRYRFRSGTEVPFDAIGVLDNATSYRYSYFSASHTTQMILRYAGSFGDHDVNAFAAYEQYYSKNTGFSATRKGLLDWNVTDITSVASMESIGGSTKQELGILSYLGSLNYAYKNRYLFGANFRADGSSRFAPGYRWGNFYALSAGWRISEEAFFEPLKQYMDNLKLKASYGELGNQVSGYYDWQSIYRKVNVVFDQKEDIGVIPYQLPNFLMSWEKTATTNIGFEALFLKQRLSLEVEYYIKKTTDMLVKPPQYLTLGVIESPQINAAALRNNGVDISIGWRDRIGKFRYSANVNLGYSVNEITKYNGKLRYELDEKTLDVWGNPTWRYTNLSDATTGGNNRIVEEHPHNEFFLRKPYQGTDTYTKNGEVDPNGGPKDGMIRTRADLDWVRDMRAAGYSFNNYTVGQAAGNLWYGTMLMEDANGDGRYGHADDIVFTGKMSIPKWTLGFNLSAEWNGFDLGMFWAGRLGSWHYIFERGVNASSITQPTDAFPADAMRLYYSYDAVAAAANGGDNDYDPAKDPNANYTGKFPRVLNAGSTIPVNTFYLYNTSYLKLKSLQVGYTLPKKWLDPARINNLRVFVSGENLLTIHSKGFCGVDPELGGSLNIYPIARMYSGGITITF